MRDLSEEMKCFINKQVDMTYELIKSPIDKLLAKTHHQLDTDRVKNRIREYFYMLYFGVKHKLEAETNVDIQPTLEQYKDFLDTKHKTIKLGLTCSNCETPFTFNYDIQTQKAWAYVLAFDTSNTITQIVVPTCEYTPTYDIELEVTSVNADSMGKIFIADWLRIGNTELSALLGFNQFESELDRGMLASKLLYDKYKPFGLVSVHGTFPRLYLNTDYDLMFGSFNEKMVYHEPNQNLESQGYRNLLIADLTIIKQLINVQYREYLGNPSDFDADLVFATFLEENKRNIISIPCGKYQGKVYNQDFPKYKDSYVYSYLNLVK